MDDPSYLYSPLNNASTPLNHMDGTSYQNFHGQQEPTLSVPLSTGVASDFAMDPPTVMNLSNSFVGFMEAQGHLLEQYIQLQSDYLKATIQQHIKLTEVQVFTLLKQKEEELISQVSALGECLKKEIEEKNTWKMIAKEKEAEANFLSSNTQPAQAIIEESSSSHGFRNEKGKQMEQANLDFIPCKLCGSGNSCMLLFPCRHLCACKICEASLEVCPMCNSKKEDSIEISLG